MVNQARNLFEDEQPTKPERTPVKILMACSSAETLTAAAEDCTRQIEVSASNAAERLVAPSDSDIVAVLEDLAAIRRAVRDLQCDLAQIKHLARSVCR